MTSTPHPTLPRSAPAGVGIPAASLHALLDDLEESGLELHSIMVLRHGSVAAEGWWAPYSRNRIHLLYSLSKSFTSTAVGFAVDEGLISLDDRIVDLLPTHVPDPVDPVVASLTLHDVLSMSTGHREDTLDRAWSLEPHDLAKGFLRLPPEEPVGSRHAYNNACTYVAGLVVQERSGEHLLDYLRPRLLEPLGIEPGRWDADGRGNALGFTGLHQRTEDLARFGQLLLQKGRWQGRQLLPQGWVELATRKHIDNDLDPAGNVDWRQGYGYQYWMSQHGFRGDGAYGQFCVVVPEADLVVATTACVEDMQGVLTALWTHLLPALDTTDDGEAAAAAELDDRLAALALPVVSPAVDGPTEGATFTIIEAGDEAPFATGATLTVAPADGLADAMGGGSTLTLTLGDHRLVVPCGRDTWVEGRLGEGLGEGLGQSRGSRGMPPARPTPVVCRGGWTTAETFEADLVLIESPHRIRLLGKAGQLEAAWNAVPLGGARLEAHVPW
ncbi:MAG: serine hydrolase [Lapillicoccus sp.]